MNDLSDNAFVTCKTPAIHTDFSFNLQSMGFRHIETSISLNRPASPAPHFAPIVRVATPEDRYDVVAVARRSFAFSRFHLDPNISNESASSIKAAWADNFFNGLRGDGLLVAECQGNIAGFLQYIHNHDSSLSIDLIAVAPEATRNHLGASMIAYAANHGALNGSSVVINVGTQACNIPAMNLYLKLGFLITRAVNIYHYHSSSSKHLQESVL